MSKHGRTQRNVRGPDDACEHGLTCRQRPLPVTRMVVFVVVFRLDVAVEVFVLVNGAGRARGLLSLGGQLERDFEPRRAQRRSLRWWRGD